ncbi:DUF2442 domain-containing protein [Nevskia sp.]|uniref:DUF2442 domain-containing protein n=1 Tax=Nevskia sp. TaxID=1929292 RepID=UPI003F70B815
MSLPLITAAHCVQGHVLQLTFSDGRSGTVDFSALLDGALPPVFAPLRDPAVLADFRLEHGTLHWTGDLDLAPEYLYFRAFAHEPGLQRQFADWGYLEPHTVHA